MRTLFCKPVEFILISIAVAAWMLGGFWGILHNSKVSRDTNTVQAEQKHEVVSTVVSDIPGPSWSITAETVGGSEAHALVLTNPGAIPNYKWQFLTNGVRMLIDRKDGNNFVQLVSEIRAAPEYMKQQGPTGNFVWNPYGLNITTAGGDVLQGWDKQTQPDGSVKMVRTQDGSEEGVTETLSSVWTVPANAEELGSDGPKASYSMTKNRGIVITKGVAEGTWRMRWALSGVQDITSDSADMRDEEGYPIRKKIYSNGEFTVDVNDFDNSVATSAPFHAFSEIGQNNKAEILFFKDGTTGNRLVDPTTVTVDIPVGWHPGRRNVFYNGAYYFLFYGKSDGSIYYKASPDNVTWGSEITLVNDARSADNSFDLYLINDSKFDVFYRHPTYGDGKVRTCTISVSSTTCGNFSAVDVQNDSSFNPSITRNPHEDRIWLIFKTDNSYIFYASTTGDAENVTGWTKRYTQNFSNSFPSIATTHGTSGMILAIAQRNAGGSGNDYLRSFFFPTTTGGGSVNDILNEDQEEGPYRLGNLIRISDTDFRLVYATAEATSVLTEYKFNGSSTWTTEATIDSGGNQKNPGIFYDTQSGDEYVFYTDTSTSPKAIFRYKKPSGGAWGSKTQVDGSEATNRSFPVTQMHETPYGASRTTPRELVWAYRVASGTNFNLMVGSLNLASTTASGTLTADIVDGSYASVASPTMTMNTSTFALSCQTATSSFGTSTQQIYVNNNNGANNGWTLTMAAATTTAVWDSAGTDYDFNDPTGSGCTDGGDADSVGGQMTVDASGATLAVGQCGSCTTGNISKGSSAAFNQGTTDSITLLSATASSDDVGDWTLRGVSISQKIPAEQPAAADYDINFVLTVTAS